MPRMLDVSDEVRAEIGDEEAARLLAGESAPGSYDCTSCRTPGDSEQERTSTVLFIGDETAVLAFAHATCLPSQVVQVTEEQLQGAVRSIGAVGGEPPQQVQQPVPQPYQPQQQAQQPPNLVPEQAVLGVTSGLVLIQNELHPALVVEPTAPVARPGTLGSGDDFLPLLIEQGFMPMTELAAVPPVLHGWSVLLAAGQLHAVLQPNPNGGRPVAWWQAHQPLQVTDGWRAAANKHQQVLMFAAPVGSVGRQPREDLMRDALDKAAANGKLVSAALPLAGI
ncbi:hypothetical protein OIE82_27705 [Streptomyces althioticus]|uniref:Uncharacterized protein n=2 Tax=Actinomycetes TaxID=1760 RepID=A0A9X5CMH7_9ACTN|nr:hypothetical protein [Actinospica acidiphila]ALV49431.1 hypothetical protein ASR50_08465 [Streptomyces sp. 4F]MCC9685292.1 hypothetical protein [Streptomyces sp. MNU103]WTB49873.1 hypothetical protein OG968_27965 [Streptomyces althioticus]GGQ68819.1 hypothetical protein GCM10010267_35110 [Streptomyces griseorubens]GGT70874.1 hypothetical protein GCM10010243_57110 [Streptomyces matensis]